MAILLAAGLGKRQQPLTNQTPKPLLRVGNRPLIDYAMNALAYSRIKTIYVVTNYLESQIIKYLEEYQRNGFDLVFCHQKTTIGTADAVNAVNRHLKRIKSITNYLVISAADYVFPEGYIKALIDFHSARSNDISVSLRDIDPTKAGNSSSVVMDTHGNLKKINEKPTNLEDDHVVAATLL
ncbi:MAG: sugar phosphate nucleotidyltransferase, partial [Desulfobacteraceae bacterium]